MRTVEEYQEQIIKSSALVWATRKKVEQFWPTPDTESNVLYAITEISEAIDAYLRNTRTEDVRNNHKDHSVEYELAQALMMLLTAGGSMRYLEERDIYSGLDRASNYMSRCKKDNICFALAGMALVVSELLPNEWTGKTQLYSNIYRATAYFISSCDWIDIDIISALETELTRIEAKWLTS